MFYEGLAAVFTLLILWECVRFTFDAILIVLKGPPKPPQESTPQENKHEREMMLAMKSLGYTKSEAQTALDRVQLTGEYEQDIKKLLSNLQSR